MADFDLNALFQQAQQIQEQMREAQERLSQKTVTGSAGGGMVVVTANGKGEIQKVQIDKQAVDPRDVPMLEDLVLAAVNSALKSAQEAAAAENPLSAMAGGLGGMIPGFPK
jgi:DNA-binding YbaB/EbfC family protein